jgi:hypothetical protein
MVVLRKLMTAAALSAVLSVTGLQSSWAGTVSDESAKVGDGQSVTESQNKSMGNSAASECIVQGESGGDAKAVNTQTGFRGLFQIGEGKLIDLGYAVRSGNSTLDNDNKNVVFTDKAKAEGIGSWEDFGNNPDFQRKIKAQIDSLNQNQFSAAAKNMVGSTINCGGSPTTVSMAMLTQGAQFGAGKVNAWAANGGNCIAAPAGNKRVGSATNDGNDKCVTWQMCNASSCSNVTKDMSKKTCDSPVMPMIKAISCSNFTGQNLQLCNYAKPFLMTDGECASAEAMAEKANKGPNKEKCENQTFGPGTGSWSYALACSWASEAVADQDGAANNTNPPMENDPECVNKLNSMGVQFTFRGQRTNGSNNGTACVIAKSVSATGTAVPFGTTLEMDCEMLLAFEQFGQKLKSLGVTSYYGISSVSECRRIRTKAGYGKSMSNHGYGRAVDFSGVIIGGKKVSMGKIWETGTAEGQTAAQIKNIACATFRGVLSPTYKGYVGAYFHNHVDMGSGHYCE